MYKGFPAEMLRLLRCPNDGGALSVVESSPLEDLRIEQGTVSCASCGGIWPIREGILCLYNPIEAHAESEHERVLRDRSRPEGTTRLEEPPPQPMEWSELRPTFEALEPLDGTTLLELGSGAGRFTVNLAPRCAQILAVDFAFGALHHLKRKLDAGARVALVQADITRFTPTPGAFDRVLSTLLSNLPSREHRLHMYRVANEALTDKGRLVGSAHHSSFISRLQGIRPAWRYAEGDIFRYCMTREEFRDESTPYFGRCKIRPIRIFLPFASRLGLAPAAMSALAGRVPGLRSFGRLLLGVMEKPVRPIPYGAVPRVPRLLRGVQTRLMQRVAREGNW